MAMNHLQIHFLRQIIELIVEEKNQQRNFLLFEVYFFQ
jgi:hypothetical protein